ncbi:MAG: preprotein translocase subunit SecE, partial [bacterium]
RKRREQEQAAGKQEQAGAKDAAGSSAAAAESRAKHDTQVPVSGDVAEVEAVIETGANVADYGEHTKAPEEDVPSGETAATENPIGSSTAPAVPGVTGGVEPGPPPSAEPVATPKPGKETRRQRKRREAKEREAAAAATEMKESPKTDKEKKGGRKAKPLPETKAEPKQRGRVVAFLASCWAELKRGQWPDRDTLIQASAVTILFVAACAAYLGVLDTVFSRLVNLIL